MPVSACLTPSCLPRGVLRLLEHGEDYVFTLPSAYARSILTIPWVELGGKVSINCAKTGYSATVIFHTKPFYGGKVHRWVTALFLQAPAFPACIGKLTARDGMS